MRLQLIPIILAIIINVAIDAYIFHKIKKGKKSAWLRHLHCVLSAVLLVLIIVAISMPRRSIDNDGLCTIMWMLFGYFSFYIPKYFALLVKALFNTPRIFRKRPLRGSGVWSSAIAVIVFLSMWWGALFTRNTVEVRNVELEFSNLPYQFNGYRIAQFSDLHLGTYSTDTAFVSKVVDEINALSPDLICFTGDIVNRCTDEAMPFIGVLSRLNAPDGVLSILGNHDYGDYMHWNSPAEREQNNARLNELQKKMGWNLMLNTDTIISRGENSICIIGVENWGEPPFPKYGKLAKAHRGLNDDSFKILLSHNSNHWRGEVLPKSNIDLMLAGHTHAMQIELSIFGLHISPSALRYNEWGGIYEEGSQKLYVNIGIGEVAIPMRIGATPEITLITLKRKK